MKKIADLTLQVRVLAQVDDVDNSENKSKLIAANSSRREFCPFH
jgi:hypothetical protein